MRHPLVLLPVLLATLVGAPPALAWTWPTDGPVLQPFVLGDDPYAAGQHRGIDVAGVTGTPVSAPAGGTVSFSGTVPGGGRTVTIQTADGYAVTLLHLGALGVARGAVVGEGDVVGTLGSSGEAEHAGPYVHLGVRVAADPLGYLDPLRFLPLRPAVTGEVAAPALEPEPAPAPETAEPAAPDLGAGAPPGTVDEPSGAAQVAPASPAVVETGAEPGAAVEAPAPAMVEAPAEVAAPQATASASGGRAVEARAPATVENGAPPLSSTASPAASAAETPAVRVEADRSARTIRPEPAGAEAARLAPAGDAPGFPVGVAAAAVLGSLVAALGLARRRRRVVPPVLNAPEAAPESAEQLVTTSVPVGPRRRTRPPAGPKRRLERLGPHAAPRSERREPVGALR